MPTPKRKIELINKNFKFFCAQLSSCQLCPRHCKVNRQQNEKGFCGAGLKPRVYTAFLHKGEEPPLSAQEGSGTIFFSGCTLRCIYCQNYKFSHTQKGKSITTGELARLMLQLQNKGAHNINLVTPTHFLPQILEALRDALGQGLQIPLVYNTSGFEALDVLQRLEGIVDIYLSDMRYFNQATSLRFSGSKTYPEVNQYALKEMYRQKKQARFSLAGIMEEGLIVRTLVLPGHIEESKNIISWLQKNIPGSYLSVMTQYEPYFQASRYKPLHRKLNKSEYNAIKSYIEALGVERGWFQEFNPEEKLAGVYFQPSLDELI